jgi:hypothetical protein
MKRRDFEDWEQIDNTMVDMMQNRRTKLQGLPSIYSLDCYLMHELDESVPSLQPLLT